MTEFRFHHPIEVRYGDLDPQGHVNNASFLTYLEQARIHYLIHLGLFGKEQSFLEVGIILADAHVTFLAPILFGMEVQVGVRVARQGNKSLNLEYKMLDAATHTVLATGATVIVTFDYRQQTTIPIPEEWRKKIAEFEGLREN